jgi:hypothetical protein
MDSRADDKEPAAKGVFDDAEEAKEVGFGEGNKAKVDADKKGKKAAVIKDEGDKAAGAEKPDDGEPGAVGFGEGRAKAEEEKAKGLDPAELESNKDLAKFVKTLRRQFKREEAYYLIQTTEVGLAPEPQAAKGDQVAMKPYMLANFEVLDGQEAAVARIVKYLGEYDPPWEKKQPAKGKRGAPAAPAALKPKRDWKLLAQFPPTKEGEAAAEDARNRKQQEYEFQLKAIEERNKPRN